MRYVRHPWLFSSQTAIGLSVSAAFLASCLVSADPIVPQPQPDTTFRLTDPVSGIAWLFFLNALVNLTCYCGVLLTAARRFLNSDSLLQTTGIRFLSALICVVVVVTAVGAIVDFYLVAQPRYIGDIHNAIGDNISGTYRVLVFDAAVWILALAIIVTSIVLASAFILRMSLKPSAVIAAGMGIVNLIVWLLIGAFGEAVAFLSILFGVMLSPVMVSYLVRWYAAGMPERGTPQAA